jgi:hypothetical protein
MENNITDNKQNTLKRLNSPDECALSTGIELRVFRPIIVRSPSVQHAVKHNNEFYINS